MAATRELERLWPDGDVLLNDPRLDEAFRSCLGPRVFTNSRDEARPIMPGETYIYWRSSGRVVLLDRKWSIDHIAECSCPWDDAMECDRCQQMEPIQACTLIRFGPELVGFVLCEPCAGELGRGFAPIKLFWRYVA